MSEAQLNVWEKALGWRKRQMIIKQLDPVTNQIRNNTLEEVAKEFDVMNPKAEMFSQIGKNTKQPPHIVNAGIFAAMVERHCMP